jgi:hypothetical protein
MTLDVDQLNAVEKGEPVTLNVSGTECVLVRKDIYLRLEAEFDTAPWTSEEMDLLADEADAIISSIEGP